MLHRLGDLMIEHMGISGCRFDRGMPERLLHQAQVAGLAQKLRGHVMSEIMDAKIADAGSLAQPSPVSLHPAIGDGVSLALHPAMLTALADISKDHLEMVPTQWP